MSKRIQIPLLLLAAALLAASLMAAAAAPQALSLQATPYPLITQTGLAQPTPYPVQEAASSPEDFDDLPVERNPFLIAGGVLIFLVILFGVWRYSRPPDEKG
jgi:hypothetical protein